MDSESGSALAPAMHGLPQTSPPVSPEALDIPHKAGLGPEPIVASMSLPNTSQPGASAHHHRGLSFHEPLHELELHARSGVRAGGRSRSTTWSTLASSYESGGVTSTTAATSDEGTSEDGSGFWANRGGTETEPSSWGFSEPGSSLDSRWKGKAATATHEHAASVAANGAGSAEADIGEPSPARDKGKRRASEADGARSSPIPRPSTSAATSRTPSIAFVDSFPAWSPPAGPTTSGRSILRSASPSLAPSPMLQQRASFRSSPAPSRPPTPGPRTEAGFSASLFQDAIENAARGRTAEASRARAFSMGHLSVPGASSSPVASRSRSRSGDRASRQRERLPNAPPSSPGVGPSRPPSSRRGSLLGLANLRPGKSGSSSRRHLFRRPASEMTLGRATPGSRASSFTSRSSRIGGSAPVSRPGSPVGENGEGGSSTKGWRSFGGKLRKALSRDSSSNNLLDLTAEAPPSDGPRARPPLIGAATTAFESDAFPFPRIQRPTSPLANLVPVNGDLTSSRGNGHQDGDTNGVDGELSASVVFKGLKSDEAANSRYLTRPVRSMSAPLLHPHQQAALSSLGALYDGTSDAQPVDIDRFDLLLPRELRISIFAALVDLCASEVSDRRRNEEARWVGRAEGVRELVKCSRVSKTWLGLVTDGQLWRRVGGGVMGPGGMGLDGLCRLMKGAGPFVKELRLRGLGAGLTSMAMLRITDGAVALEDSGRLTMGLTALDLTGCRGISNQSLHYLLSRSPYLVELSLKGLPAVNDSTCDLLHSLGAPLTHLDVRQCQYMSAQALVRACEALRSTLKVLLVGKLRFLDDQALADLGGAVPDLEELDVSYNSLITDGGLRGFVAVASAVSPMVHHPLPKESKRVTKLIRLNVSSCRKLTDKAFDALAGTVPDLRVLEAANIGTEVKDAGLLALFATTPLIEKIDLEDANEITDRVLYAITPATVRGQSRLRGRQPVQDGTTESPQPGQVLDHLVLSYAVHLSDAALVSLIRSCPRLRILELDNTRVGDGVVKQFVKQARQRATRGAELGAVDARGIGRTVVNEVEGLTRTRRGRRGWWAKQMEYSNGRGVAEFDDAKVVVHTFWSWSRLDEHQRQRAAARASARHGAQGLDSESAAAGLWGVLGLDNGRRPTPRRASPSTNCTIM